MKLLKIAHKSSAAMATRKQAAIGGQPPISWQQEDNSEHEFGAKAAATTPTTSGNHQAAPIRRQVGPASAGGRRMGSILLIAAIALQLLHSGCLFEAKIHHSKRQTTQTEPPTPTGREHTNWWNLWWQQYINEAVQPTVRPIIGVSFNGRSISLQESEGESASNNNNFVEKAQFSRVDKQQVGPVDVDTNFVLSNSNLAKDRELDLAREEKLRLVASNLADNPTMEAKQMLLVQRKSVQNQANWRSVKPTMIQPVASRDARQNRQVGQASEGESEAEQPAQIKNQMGIQMRVNTISNGNRLPAANSNGPAANSALQRAAANRRLIERQQQQQQQQMMMIRAEEEQQQNQMADYSEESEPELDGNDNEQRISPVDSSSSSMMLEQRPGSPKLASSALGASQPTQAAAAPQRESQQQRQPTKSGGSVTRAELESARKALQSGGNQQEQATVFSTTQQPRTTGQLTTTTMSTPIRVANEDRQMSTTSSSLQTSTVETSETPISINDSLEQPKEAQSESTTKQQPRQQTAGARASSPSPTTPSGRVELENGRPATPNGMRQKASTNSARLPTTQARPTTTQSAGSESSRTGGSRSSATAAPNSRPTTKRVESNSERPSSATARPAIATTLPTSTTSSSPSSITTTTGRPTSSSVRTTTVMPNANQAVELATLKTLTMRDMLPVNQSLAESSTTMSTKPASVSSGDDSGSSTTVASDTEDGGAEDEEEETEEGGNNAGNLMNSAGDSDSDDSAGDDASEETDQDQLTTTTTSRPQKGAKLGSPTTQQPSFTTIDIERLPKGGQSSSSISSMSVSSEDASRSMMSTLSGQQPTTSTTTSSMDITRITSGSESDRPSPPALQTQPAQSNETNQQQQQQQQRQQMNEDLVMMNLDQGRTMMDGGETAITMPMDTLLKMMIMNQADIEGNRMPSSPSDLTTSPIRMQTTESPFSTTTTSATATTISGNNDNLASSREESSVDGLITESMRMDANPTTATPLQSTSSGSDSIAGQTAEQSSGSPGAATTAGKKRLQPPPSTRAPMRAQQMQASTTGGSTSSSGLVGLAGQRPTMMVSIEEPVDGGGEEPKIELLNLDLMPIQRVMSSQMQQQQQQQTKGDKLSSPMMKSPIRQQQQQQTSAASNKQRPIQKQQQAAMDQSIMLEVEPGMRLRPMTNQQLGPASNQANTVYMIMMNSPNEAHSKRPVQMQMGTSNQNKGQRPASPGSSSMRTSAMPQMQSSTRQQQQQQPMQQFATTVSMPTKTSNQIMSLTSSTTSARLSQTQQQPSTSSRSMLRTTQPAMTFSSVQQTTKSPLVQTTTLSVESNQSEDRAKLAMANAGDDTATSVKSPDGNAIEMQQQQREKDLSRMMIMMNGLEMAEREREREQLEQTSTMKPGSASSPSMRTTSSSSSSSTSPTSRASQSIIMMTTTTSPTTTSGPQRATTSATPTTTFTSTSSTSASSDSSSSSGSPASTTSAPSGNSDGPATGGSDMDLAKQQPEQSRPTTQRQQQGQLDELDGGRIASTSSAAPTTGNDQVQFERLKEAGGDSSSTGTSAIENGRPQSTTSQSKSQKQQLPATKSISQSQLQQQQQQQRQGKVGKPSNSTSSFIPSKLRTDFNSANNKFDRVQPQSQTQSQPANEGATKMAANQQQTQSQGISNTSAKLISANELPRIFTGAAQSEPINAAQMAQSQSAIRQFGGANRMSVLANRPVPFGRPAAMTMQTGARFELPAFEYGPSIAVRRPDEPLANGQVPNCTLTGKNFCVLTKDYPMNEVRQAVERSFRSVRIMYEELQTVSDQELHKDDFNATNNQAASGKFACQTQVEMMRPGWAKDEITKEWMLVVNTDVFPQRVRTESCAQPNTPCEFIAPFYDSTCQQRYSLHRMIAIDPHDPSRSPQVAVFKFPAGCVCRVHPIRKTTMSMIQPQQSTTIPPTSTPTSTSISSSTSKSIRRKR